MASKEFLKLQHNCPVHLLPAAKREVMADPCDAASWNPEEILTNEPKQGYQWPIKKLLKKIFLQ